MFFGLTIEKLLLIGLVAALIVGPERLPRYAESLAGFTRRARDWVTTARTRRRGPQGGVVGALARRPPEPPPRTAGGGCAPASSTASSPASRSSPRATSTACSASA